MESEMKPSLIMMDAESLKSLLSEVKETIATGLIFPGPVKSSFSEVDMWNIRKGAKSASSMIRR